jgi:hypothetical protein
VTGVRRLASRLLLVALGACGVFQPQPLDLAPGQRVVLGRIDLSGFEVSEGIVEFVREDQTFGQEIRTGHGAREFAVGLPPGRYRVARLRAAKESIGTPNQVVWPLGLTFEVGGDAAVYVGTLRVNGAFGRDLRFVVVDELEDTLRVLRTRYANLPDAPVRALMKPA